jgi:transcription elongation factor GreA-like protein
MLLAHKVYEKNEKVSNNILTIKNIEEYNEIDCKCLWEIIEYLRKHH